MDLHYSIYIFRDHVLLKKCGRFRKTQARVCVWVCVYMLVSLWRIHVCSSRQSWDGGFRDQPEAQLRLGDVVFGACGHRNVSYRWRVPAWPQPTAPLLLVIALQMYSGQSVLLLLTLKGENNKVMIRHNPVNNLSFTCGYSTCDTLRCCCCCCGCGW